MRIDVNGAWCPYCERMVYTDIGDHQARHAREMERASIQAARDRDNERVRELLKCGAAVEAAGGE